jgi:hypothetical protein
MNKEERKKGREKARKQIEEYFKKNPDKTDLFKEVFTAELEQEEN